MGVKFPASSTMEFQMLNYRSFAQVILVGVGSVRISVSGEVIPGAAQRGCPLYLRCSMPDLMR